MKRIFIFLLTASLLAFYGIFIVFRGDTLLSLTREDGAVEMFGALSLLGASVCFLAAFFRDKRGNDFFVIRPFKNVFFLLLGVLFFFGFGEEISWGQRIFKYKAPEKLETINEQGEFNVHNMPLFHGVDKEGKRKPFLKLLLNFDRLFSLFWLSFGILIPLLNKVSSSCRRFFHRTNIPIVPLWLGSFFLINYAVAKVFEIFVVTQLELRQPLTESKETIFGFAFLLIGLYFLSPEAKAGSASPALSGPE